MSVVDDVLNSLEEEAKKEGKKAVGLIRDENIPNGTRHAKCMFCSNKAISRPDLPFFRKCDDTDHDRYYCGCIGWD